MQPGRTPTWNLVADFAASSWIEASKLGSDDRIVLPANVRRRLGWGAPKGSLQALAVIGADGEVSVVPMTEGRKLLKKLEGALASHAEEDRRLLTLSAMAHYSQVALQEDGRLRLSPPVMLHLKGDAATKESRVWVGAYEGHLSLWPEEIWMAVAKARSVELERALAEAAPT
jgi:DNA-binding transcriptional regulator/RsmH inhibitor MraZ